MIGDKIPRIRKACRMLDPHQRRPARLTPSVSPVLAA
jgi:hypothetical protein